MNLPLTIPQMSLPKPQPSNAVSVADPAGKATDGRSTPPAAAAAKPCSPLFTDADAPRAASKTQAGPPRRNFLVLVSSPDGARAIQNALNPQGPSPFDRGDARSTTTTPSAGVSPAHPSQPAPLLTFARSREGVEFCLAEDPHGTVGYDAVLWEMSHDSAEALASAPDLVRSAASVPVVGVRFSVPSSPSQKGQLRTAALATGLREIVGAGELSLPLLEDCLGGGKPSADAAPNAAALQSLCEQVRLHVHDVRNPLSCIQMLTDLMCSNLRSGEGISAADLYRISKSVERAEAVIGDLVAIAKSVEATLAAPKN